jgi:hypothetical protein
VTAGQPVPPPFVTAVARIVRDSDGATMCEARKRVCIPQVVKFVYEPAAVTCVKSGLIRTNNGMAQTVVSPMTDAEWMTQKNRIRNIAQAFYDAASANVRFVNDEVSPSQPFSVLTLQYATGVFGGADLDFLNANPSDSGGLYALELRDTIGVYIEFHNPHMVLPVSANEVGFLWGRVAAHETGHTLGLVKQGAVLDGSLPGPDDESGNHNKAPSGCRAMNPGEASSLEEKLGRGCTWGWLARNADYLKFILPKE